MANKVCISMPDMVKWHASDFYPNEKNVLAGLIASEGDFEVTGNAKKTDMTVEIDASGAFMSCSVTVGTDVADAMMGEALFRLNGKSIDCLTDSQFGRIFNGMDWGGVTTECICGETIPRRSTYEEVMQVLDECENDALEEYERNLRWAMTIVQEVIKEREDVNVEKL